MKKSGELSALCLLMLSISATGCAVSGGGEAEEAYTPMKYNTEEIEDVDYSEEDLLAGYQDFSMNLFNECCESAGDSNVMISPTSVMLAMEMVSAGANGDTEQQITDMLCAGADGEEVQAFAAAMSESLQDSDDVKMHIANSAWINEAVLAGKINSDYVDYLEDNFSALTTSLPFNGAAVEQINDWVADNTDDMIPGILDEMPQDASLILINAICFDGKWMEPYEEYQIEDGVFHNADGSTSDVTMLNETMGAYYSLDDAEGFIKYYEGGDYAFVAILPSEEMSANEYAAKMTAQDFRDLMESVSYDYDVVTQMPEFKSEYEIRLNDILQTKMGIVDAFNPEQADLTNIAMLENDNLYIDCVYHKTFIEVDRDGTRAAAVTAVIVATCCLEEPKEVKEIILDRPFVYAIIDTNTYTPVFIGTTNSIDD